LSNPVGSPISCANSSAFQIEELAFWQRHFAFEGDDGGDLSDMPRLELPSTVMGGSGVFG